MLLNIEMNIPGVENGVVLSIFAFHNHTQNGQLKNSLFLMQKD